MAQKVKQGVSLLGTFNAAISVSGSGQSELVAAVADRRIRVTQALYLCDAAMTVRFQSANTDLTGAMSYAINGGAATPYSELGWFTTAKGEALNVTISAGGLRGVLKYDLIS